MNAQLAVLSTPLAAPVITGSRLRRGNAASGKGAAKLLTGALATARSAGISGRVLVRADSAYYRHNLIHAAIRAGAWFSVTARQDAKVSAATATIDDSAWATINYPNALFDQQLGGWISSAQVAETRSSLQPGSGTPLLVGYSSGQMTGSSQSKARRRLMAGDSLAARP